jgi:hypothetical protein
VITYEYPFNERIRTLLRLEDLFEKTSVFTQSDGQLEHHTALVTLFEILEVAGRADLKMDLIQELERQRQTLLAYRNNPDISGSLGRAKQSSAALLSMRKINGRVGIKSRARAALLMAAWAVVRRLKAGSSRFWPGAAIVLAAFQRSICCGQRPVSAEFGRLDEMKRLSRARFTKSSNHLQRCCR